MSLGLVLLAATALAPAPAMGASGGCGGVMPAGFAIARGVPYSTDPFFGGSTSFNPQTVALFTSAALKDTRNTAAQRLCWAGVGTQAMLDHSTTFTTEQGASARAYPYLSDFSAHPTTPTLRAPWYSALGQSSCLDVMMRMYTATKKPVYLEYARQSFEVFTVRGGPYAVVTEDRGMTYLQEYVTAPDTYVLNGNNEALYVLHQWARTSDDPRAADLVSAVAAALERTLPLHEIRSPIGLVTSYDLLRGATPAAPLRVTGTVTVHQAGVSEGGHMLSSLAIPVVRPPTAAANVLVNPRLATGPTSRVPTGWRSGTPRAMTRVGSPFPALRLSSTSTSTTVYQDIPAASVRPSTRYRLSVKGALVRRGAVASSSLLTSLVATCPSGARMLARSQIRWTGAPNWIDVVGTTPTARCPLRVMLTAQYPAATTVDLAEISLAPAEVQGTSAVPRYPVSVLDHPTLDLALTYSGTGALQAYASGRWWTLTRLAAGNRARIDYRVPGWIQGRNINLRYHEHHVQELDVLARALGCAVCKTYGRRWLDVAPGEWPRLTSLS